jgi:poly-gamma-glutamate capsule biosynthesis protein CapA/YwtB (metallophosphatase superfamily)
VSSSVSAADPTACRRPLRPWVCVCAAVLVIGTLGGCSRPAKGVPDGTHRPALTIRLLLGGDVMLGRGVGEVAESDPNGLFADVRFVVSSADLAIANLESPLTTRPHVSGAANALEASPSTAGLLASAGFDAVSLANNHAGDAGPASVTDTIDGLRAVGMVGVGGGADASAAFAPVVVRRNGLRVALLAFDATGGGLRAGEEAGDGGGEEAGVAWWGRRARSAVAAARSRADLLVVGLHAGAEYQAGTDPFTMATARSLARMGVDVVWVSGPHVVQPVHVIDPDGDGRPTLVGTSLGNFLFDQSLPGTQRGLVLEGLAGADGLIAWRAGGVSMPDRRAHFTGWRLPRGDAVALGGEWWALARPANAAAAAEAERLPMFPGWRWTVTASAAGDADGNGSPDVVVSFRRPFHLTGEKRQRPRHPWMDAEGRSAHLGVWSASDLRPIWVAGTLVRPVGGLAACNGALAVGFTRLNSAGIVATGAWFWNGFGFDPAADLPGLGVPMCADVDRDGRADPVILGRNS